MRSVVHRLALLAVLVVAAVICCATTSVVSEQLSAPSLQPAPQARVRAPRSRVVATSLLEVASHTVHTADPDDVVPIVPDAVKEAPTPSEIAEEQSDAKKKKKKKKSSDNTGEKRKSKKKRKQKRLVAPVIQKDTVGVPEEAIAKPAGTRASRIVMVPKETLLLDPAVVAEAKAKAEAKSRLVKPVILLEEATQSMETPPAGLTKPTIEEGVVAPTLPPAPVAPAVPAAPLTSLPPCPTLVANALLEVEDETETDAETDNEANSETVSSAETESTSEKENDKSDDAAEKPKEQTKSKKKSKKKTDDTPKLKKPFISTDIFSLTDALVPTATLDLVVTGSPAVGSVATAALDTPALVKPVILVEANSNANAFPATRRLPQQRTTNANVAAPPAPQLPQGGSSAEATGADIVVTAEDDPKLIFSRHRHVRKKPAKPEETDKGTPAAELPIVQQFTDVTTHPGNKITIKNGIASGYFNPKAPPAHALIL